MSDEDYTLTRRDVLTTGGVVIGQSAFGDADECGLLDKLLGRCETESDGDDGGLLGGDGLLSDGELLLALISRADHPADADIGEGNVAVYAKGATLYQKAHGADPAIIGGGDGALSIDRTAGGGGDVYQLPQAADSLDLQGDGEIKNAESVETDVLGIAGFEQVEKDGEIDVGGEIHGPSNKVTYTINDTKKDAYILVLESFGVDGGGGSDHRLRYNGYGSGSGEDDYRFVDSFGKTVNVTYLGLGKDGGGMPFTGAWLIEYYDGLQDNQGRNQEINVAQIRGALRGGGTGLQSGGVADSDKLAPPSSFEIWENSGRQYTPDAKIKVLKVTYL